MDSEKYEVEMIETERQISVGSNMDETNHHMIRLTYLRNKKNSIIKKYDEVTEKKEKMADEID